MTETTPSIESAGLPIDPPTIDRIWDSGVLGHLTVSCFRARLGLAAEDVDADPSRVVEIVSLGHKSLFDDEMMKPLKKAEGKARNAFIRHSLEFPVGSARFIPLKTWPVLEAQLQEAKKEFDEATRAFLDSYESNRDDMCARFPSHLRLQDYPSKESLKFSMDWATFTLAPANADMAAKVKSAIDEFVRDAVATLRSRVGKTCREQAQRLADGKPISEASLKALRSMVAQFDSLNFVGDENVERAIATLRAQLDIRSAKEVRESQAARTELVRVLDLVTQAANRDSDAERAADGFLGRIVQIDNPDAPSPAATGEDSEE